MARHRKRLLAKPCLVCGVPQRLGYYCANHVPQKDYEPNDAEQKRVRKQVLSEERVCWICGQPPTEDDPLTLDHVVPRVEGGRTERANGRAAHASCNSRRGAELARDRNR